MRLATKAGIYRMFVVALVALSMNGIGGIQAQKRQTPTASPKIIDCIKNGDVACTSEFLANGGKASAVDQNGLPLLVLASETKSATLVRLLLNAGADPNDAGPGDATPLCRAALFGRKEIAQALLETGAKVDVLCDADHGDSALMEAIRGSMLSDWPEEFRETILNPEEIQDSADNEKEADEKTAKAREILAVSSADFIDIAYMLLARGVDVNVIAKCDGSESALMYAAMAANVDMVNTLLAHGADLEKEPTVLDTLRETEREYHRARLTSLPAVSRQRAAMLDWMEKSKARRDEIIRILKAAGAKESERNEEEVIVENADEEAVQEFRDVIEQNDIKDFERLLAAYEKYPLAAAVLQDALRVAVIYSRVEIVKLLLGHGVNPDIPSTSVRYTPLMQAASSANLELVKLLIDAGCDLNAENENGRTALDEAEMYTHASEAYRTVVAFLKERGARSGKEKK